jgi:hypothetical protein
MIIMHQTLRSLTTKSTMILLGLMTIPAHSFSTTSTAMEIKTAFLEYRGIYTSKDEELERSIMRQFRDLNDTYPSFAYMKTLTSPPASKPISGIVRYYKTIDLPYRYNVVSHEGELIIALNIHVHGHTRATLGRYVSMLKQAQDLWNDSRPQTFVGFPYRYQFIFVNTEKEAHFSVKNIEGGRGPYMRGWDFDLGHQTMAHEIGHMLGLADEYGEYNRNDKNCPRVSLMCSGTWRYNRRPLPWHHYHVLRRALL